jgi:hypothetical protein
MGSVLKFAFIAGLTFLVAAEVAYGQAQDPKYGTNGPGIQQRVQNQEQRMKSDGQLTTYERQKSTTCRTAPATTSIVRNTTARR